MADRKDVVELVKDLHTWHLRIDYHRRLLIDNNFLADVLQIHGYELTRLEYKLIDDWKLTPEEVGGEGWDRQA